MAKSKIPAIAVTKSQPPYAFRTGWALLLLAVNFVVAAYYFHIIQ